MMRRLIPLLLWLLISSVAQATTYYVRTDGKGSNCSQYQTNNSVNAANSILAATNCTSPGDTVSVASGTYPGDSNSLSRGGNASAQLIIKSEVKWGAVIDCGTTQNCRGFNLQDYTTLDGFEVKGGGAGIAFDSGYNQGMIIINNNIHDVKYSVVDGSYPSGQPRVGIATDNTSATNPRPNQIMFNYIHDNGVTYLDHGIYARATNDIIANNLFVNNQGGSQIDLSGNGALPLNGTKVYNNTVAYGTQGIEFYRNVDNVQVINNLIFQNSASGINSYNCDSNGTITVDRNLLYGNGGNNQIDIGAGTCAKTITETNTVRANPNLTNPSNGDFTLQSSSTAAIDAGAPLGSPYNVDYANISRPQGAGWDIGAYEFASVPLPVVTINRPTSPNCVGTSDTCTITGSANNTLNLTGSTTQTGGTVTWACTRCTGAGTTTGSWVTSLITLKSGTNIITVTGVDGGGNIGTDTITITFVPTFPGNTLVGAWGFEDGSGSTTTDSSGNKNNGALVNTPTWTTLGKFGNAISFDGISQYINVADANSLDLTQSFTISAWVNPAASHTDFRSVLHKNSDPSGSPYQLYGSVSGYCGSGGVAGFTNANGTSGPQDTACSTTPLAVNQWTHLALTYDNSAGQLKLYKNGVLMTTTAHSGYMEPSTLALIIGGSEYGEYWHGALDEVRLYNWAVPLTAGGNTVMGAACATSGGVQTNIATPSVTGDANCPVVAQAVASFKIPSSATGLKLGAGATQLKVGR